MAILLNLVKSCYVIFPLGEPASTHEPIILRFLLIFIFISLLLIILVYLPQEAVFSRSLLLVIIIRVELVRMMTHTPDVRRRLPSFARVVSRVAGRRAGTAAPGGQSRHRQCLAAAIPRRFVVLVAGSRVSTVGTVIIIINL